MNYEIVNVNFRIQILIKMQLNTIIMLIHVPDNSMIYFVLNALVKYICTSNLYPKTIKEKWQKILIGKYNVTRNEQASIKCIQNLPPSK